jgi:hypothetical protein
MIEAMTKSFAVTVGEKAPGPDPSAKPRVTAMLRNFNLARRRGVEH